MSFAYCMAFTLLALAPFAVAAQDTAHSRDPADPAGAAAPPVYESAFRNYLKTPGQEEASDTAWRDANIEVGRLGGHAGHAKAAEPSPTATTAPSAPKAAPAAHEHHHGMRHGSGERQ